MGCVRRVELEHLGAAAGAMLGALVGCRFAATGHLASWAVWVLLCYVSAIAVGGVIRANGRLVPGLLDTVRRLGLLLAAMAVLFGLVDVAGGAVRAHDDHARGGDGP
jgi:hypothetical protein